MNERAQLQLLIDLDEKMLAILEKYDTAMAIKILKEAIAQNKERLASL